MNDTKPPASMQPPGGSADRDFLFQLAIDMDCKELPAPPPPSPEYRTAYKCQPIDELLMLSKIETAGHTERTYSPFETGANKNVAFAHHSGSRNSPLRQVSSQVDVDAYSKRSSSPGRYRRRECSLLFDPFNDRHVTPDSSGRDRSLSASSLQGVSKSASRRASPAFNMAYLRSTVHGIPTARRGGTSSPLNSPPQSCPQSLLKGRQISSPIISDEPSSPTLFDFPRPVTPSTAPQSRSDCGSTHSSEPLRKEEPISYFSDSEEEEKHYKRSSSKKGSLGKGGSWGRSRRFRRRLSGTIAFFSCGME